LLHHLKRGTKDSLAEVRVGLPDGTLEAVGPRAEPGGGGNKLTLVLLVGDNLGKLDLDILGVGVLATKTGQRVGGSSEVTLLDEVAGRVGKAHETTGKDDSPDELDTDGNTVNTGVGPLLSSVDDASGKHEADGNAKLITGDQGTTNLARALQTLGS
jgi:hypothetical protein